MKFTEEKLEKAFAPAPARFYRVAKQKTSAPLRLHRLVK